MAKNMNEETTQKCREHNLSCRQLNGLLSRYCAKTHIFKNIYLNTSYKVSLSYKARREKECWFYEDKDAENFSIPKSMLTIINYYYLTKYSRSV